MEFKVEQFEDKHLLLRESFFETLKNLSDVLILDMETTKELLDKIKNQGGNIFVAVSDEHGIIGTTTLLVEQKIIKGGALAGHIEDVATRKGFTGYGIASKLIERAVQEAKQKGCYKIVLDCKENLAPFYKKSGFQREGIFMRLYLK